jgi:hypothetical protein
MKFLFCAWTEECGIQGNDVGFGVASTIFVVALKFYGSCYQNMVLDLNTSEDMGIDAVR